MPNYFKEIPSIEYSFKFSGGTETLPVKSINTTVRFTELTRDTTDNFYPYVMEEGERPDLIADFYYDNPNRYWIVLLSNNSSDLYYDFKLNDKTFIRYLIKKYSADAGSEVEADVLTYLQSTVKFYKDIDGYVIDKEQYDTLSTLNRSLVYIYDWEVDLNQERANIQLASNEYTTKIERQFKDLMNKR